MIANPAPRLSAAWSPRPVVLSRSELLAVIDEIIGQPPSGARAAGADDFGGRNDRGLFGARAAGADDFGLAEPGGHFGARAAGAEVFGGRNDRGLFGTSDWQPESLPDPHTIVPGIVLADTSSTGPAQPLTYAERAKIERVAAAISDLAWSAPYNLPTGRRMNESGLARELRTMWALDESDEIPYRLLRGVTGPFDRLLRVLGYTGDPIQANPVYVLRYRLPGWIARQVRRIASPLTGRLTGRPARLDPTVLMQLSHVKEVGDTFCLAARLYLIAGNDERAVWNFSCAFDPTAQHDRPLSWQVVEEFGGLPDEVRQGYLDDLRLAARANRRRARNLGAGSRHASAEATKVAIELYERWHEADMYGREVTYAERRSPSASLIYATSRDRWAMRLKAGLWRRCADLTRESDPIRAAYYLHSAAESLEAAGDAESFHTTNREAIELLADALEVEIAAADTRIAAAQGDEDAMVPGYPLSLVEIESWLEDEDLDWAQVVADRLGVQPRIPRLVPFDPALHPALDPADWSDAEEAA